MKTLYKILSLLFLLLSTSCNDFLDTLPDNRTQIDTEKKITQLLISAYPEANYSVLAELSSDNFVDNNAILSVNLSSYDRMHDEIYAWQEVTSSTQEDSPSYVWQKCYAAIAAANHALEAIQEMETLDKNITWNAQKGEALLCRAYSHFILVNIFSQAYKDENASSQDIGIPYITKPETVVKMNSPRETVTSVYTKIQADLELGIPLISDQLYSIPKYHFNKKAAAAFAARFFLYKRDYQKVVDFSTDVLTSRPENMMRDWTKDYDNITAISYDYISTLQTCNFLILPTNSVFSRIFGTRYGHNGEAMLGSTYGTGPTWPTTLPCFTGKLYISNQQDYGVFFPKADEMIEYTDKIAGIGYTHVVRAEFTAEETLLCRAEALIYLNRTTEALADLQVWNASHIAPIMLTEAIIKDFYTPNNTLFVKPLNSTKMSSSFVITAAQKPFINCVLHFRRIETMFDGYRWFDIKRYGIEIQHAIGKTLVDKLTYNDYRRAIQLPQEVISAGVNANPRTLSTLPSSQYTLFTDHK